ncbi:hypothetical protein OAS86_02835 [Gammaproteobacteria bacterium]|nr:hypothetical protein [Gammaproteobacteria bacterium]
MMQLQWPSAAPNPCFGRIGDRNYQMSEALPGTPEVCEKTRGQPLDLPVTRHLIAPFRSSVGGRDQDVRGQWKAQCLQVQFARIATLSMDMGRARSQLTPGPDYQPHIASELGLALPVLIDHAANGLFAWHGSALRIGQQIHLLVGDSGQGKSTLARRLSTQIDDCERIADDILLFDPDTREPLLPYPQLKTEHPLAAPPIAGLRIDAIHLLNKDGNDVALRPARGAASGLALYRHLASVRLFPPAWQAAALESVSKIARECQIDHLDYPHTEASIDQVATLLTGCR